MLLFIAHNKYTDVWLLYVRRMRMFKQIRVFMNVTREIYRARRFLLSIKYHNRYFALRYCFYTFKIAATASMLEMTKHRISAIWERVIGAKIFYVVGRIWRSCCNGSQDESSDRILKFSFSSRFLSIVSRSPRLFAKIVEMCLTF